MVGEALARALDAYIIGIAVTFFLAGALVVWGLPKLWHLVKPWLHVITG